MNRFLAALPFAALVACGDPEDSDTAAFCADAPVTTYDNFGQGFLTENCQTCHASGSADRNSAPADVIFDTEGDVAAQADLILAMATGDEPQMPPEGGVTDDDRSRLEIWLRCYPP